MNTFKYQEEWTKEYQKSNWTMPIYPVIADLQFTAGLKKGDTVWRRYRSNPIVANDLGSDGSYSVQNYVEAEESFTISKQKEASVRIVKPEVLHTDLNTTKSYGAQLSNAIYQDIDGDTLNAARAGAGQTIDDGSFGGTSGNGLTVSIANIADIPVLAMEKFIGSSVVYNNNMRFGKLAFEDYGGMLTWIVPPQTWTMIQKYLLNRGTQLGDRVVTNGYKGEFGDFQVFVSNNLPFTARLELGQATPGATDGDTFTIKGVTFRMKATPSANGDIDIGSDVETTATNIAAALNAPGTASATFDPFTSSDTISEGGYTIEKTKALHGLVATADATGVDIVMKGTGKVTLSETFADAGNEFTAAKQCVNSIFMVAKNVSLAVRKDPEIYENSVSGAVARDYVMWTVYDNKVFRDQARAIINFKVRCDASSFTAYSNVKA